MKFKNADCKHGINMISMKIYFYIDLATATKR